MGADGFCTGSSRAILTDYHDDVSVIDWATCQVRWKMLPISKDKKCQIQLVINDPVCTFREGTPAEFEMHIWIGGCKIGDGLCYADQFKVIFCM